MCAPCKVVVNEETENCAAMAGMLRELIIANVDDPEEQDELLYQLAASERLFIRKVRGVAARLSIAINASPRWQTLMHDLAGLPVHATPGGPAATLDDTED